MRLATLSFIAFRFPFSAPSPTTCANSFPRAAARSPSATAFPTALWARYSCWHLLSPESADPPDPRFSPSLQDYRNYATVDIRVDPTTVSVRAKLVPITTDVFREGEFDEDPASAA